MSGARERSSALAGSHLTVGYGAGEPVLTDQSVALPSGRITALIGPNGSGKSTLLKALSRQLQPRHGSVLLDGQAISRLAPRELARRLGILFQEKTEVAGITVEELVMHGRHPYRGFFEDATAEDQVAVEQALSLTGTLALRHRLVSELSGGQRQLAWLALALAQQPRILLLDEPTTFLDLRHQIEVMEVIVSLRSRLEITVAMVVHDVNQAARYADHLVALREGRVVAEGPPCELLTPSLLRTLFAIEADVLRAADGVPTCIPRGLAPR